MNSDGSGVRQLTPWGLRADTADLSQATSGPTRDLVVFESYGHGGPPPGAVEDIMTVPTTCSSVDTCTAQIQNLTRTGDGPMDSNNGTHRRSRQSATPAAGCGVASVRSSHDCVEAVGSS